MQVIPLLFIDNWPGPSVGAIYRADCSCFAQTLRGFLSFFVYSNENITEGLAFVKLQKVVALWFF